MSKPIETAISLDSIVAASPDQVSCDLSGEVAILNLKNGMYYGLEEVGAAIWNLVAEPKPVSRILEALLDRYEVDHERCRNDLLTLLGMLNTRGLIRVTDEGAG